MGLGSLYASLPPADKCHFIDGLGLLSEIGADLPPRGLHPSLPAIEGGLRYVWAHRLRGFAVADLTSDAQAMNMYEMGDMARQVLEEAAALTPGDSAVHAFRIRTLTLVGGPDGMFEAMSRDLAATGEANVNAELVRLNYLSPKWHGSVGEMHALADAAIANPPNAAFFALKARAWIEEWLYETAMNDDEGAAKAMKARTETGEFRQALADLDDRFLEQLAAGPEMTPAEAHFARNHFAFLFAAFLDKARLTRHLAALKVPAATPWGYLAGKDVPGYIAGLRKACGLPRV